MVYGRPVAARVLSNGVERRPVQRKETGADSRTEYLMPRPYFRCSVFPDLVTQDGGRIGRFFLPTSWQIQRATRPGVEGVPRRFDSLLDTENLFHSVLPYRFRHQHRIHTR